MLVRGIEFIHPPILPIYRLCCACRNSIIHIIAVRSDREPAHTKGPDRAIICDIEVSLNRNKCQGRKETPHEIRGLKLKYLKSKGLDLCEMPKNGGADRTIYLFQAQGCNGAIPTFPADGNARFKLRTPHPPTPQSQIY